MITKMQERKIVGIVIPVFNRIEITRSGLKILNDSISRVVNGNVIYEVIVVDDGSSDGTSEMISDNFENVHLLHGDGNLWWAGAINVGAKFAIDNLQCEYILLWNDDTIPDEYYFKNLNDYLDRGNLKNEICCSLVKEYDSKKIWFNGAFYSNVTGHFRHWITDNNENNPINCSTGMGTLIPSKIVIENKYWDAKNFPQYYADVDFTLRAYKLGAKFVVNSNMMIFNRIEFSSFNQKCDINNYIPSLKKIQSRYNVLIEIKFHLRHCKTPFWIYYLMKKHFKYLINNIIMAY